MFAPRQATRTDRISTLSPWAMLVGGIGCGGGSNQNEDASTDNYSVTATDTARTIIHDVSIPIAVQALKRDLSRRYA
jgi:hypothetical protein